MGKTVPEVLDITQDRRPKAVHKTEGTVFFQYGPTLAGEEHFYFFLKPNKWCERV